VRANKAPLSGKGNIRGLPDQAFPLIIAEWPKSNGLVVRVALDKFKGRTYINARVWYTAADGELRPAKNGIGLSVRHLPDLIRAFQDALERARDLDVMEGGGER
jgi:hypothetical protein